MTGVNSFNVFDAPLFYVFDAPLPEVNFGYRLKILAIQAVEKQMIRTPLQQRRRATCVNYKFIGAKRYKLSLFVD